VRSQASYYTISLMPDPSRLLAQRRVENTGICPRTQVRFTSALRRCSKQPTVPARAHRIQCNWRVPRFWNSCRFCFSCFEIAKFPTNFWIVPFPRFKEAGLGDGIPKRTSRTGLSTYLM
jgi:hypothetical protein